MMPTMYNDGYQIGQVISVDTTTSIVELLTGDQLRVNGVGDINNTYLIRDGILLLKIPDKNLTNITIG